MAKKILSKLFYFVLSAAFFGGLLFYFFPLPGNASVLMYHFVGSKVDADWSKNYVSRESFAAQMKFLDWFGYRVISLDEYYQVLSGARRPQSKEVVLTFDDGNMTFESDAFPVLKRHKFPATIFLVSENLKTGNAGSMTTDIVRPMLSSGLITIGSHSKTHPLLSKIKPNQIYDELTGSKSDLEAMFGVPVHYLAYPGGDVNSKVLELTREAGYRLAFSTAAKKVKGLPEGAYTLPRIKISRSADNLFVFWVKISGLYEYVKKLRA